MTAAARSWDRLRVWHRVLVVSTLAIACAGGDRDASARTKDTRGGGALQLPEWLKRVEIRVERTQPAFDHNTEVFLQLANRSQTPIVIQNLNENGVAALVHKPGVHARIHAISVGVKKPIVIAPGEVKSMSLLFEAAEGTPRALLLYGEEFPIAVDHTTHQGSATVHGRQSSR